MRSWALLASIMLVAGCSLEVHVGHPERPQEGFRAIPGSNYHPLDTTPCGFYPRPKRIPPPSTPDFNDQAKSDHDLFEQALLGYIDQLRSYIVYLQDQDEFIYRSYRSTCENLDPEKYPDKTPGMMVH